MDSIHSRHHALSCSICETAVPTLHCDMCQMRLCTICVGEHLSDASKEHKAVPFKMQGSTILCKEHSTKTCELHCEQCDSPICALCISSDKHEQHKKNYIWKKMDNKKADLQKDLQELELILPKYEAITSRIPNQKANLEKNSQTLKSDIDKHGDEWHKAVDTVIQKYKSDIDEMDKTNKTILNQQEKEITQTILAIQKSIVDLKRLVDSFDFYSLSEYKSKNTEFRRIPSQPVISLPRFTPRDIDKRYIKQQFGFISMLPTTKTGNDVFMNYLGCASSLPQKPFVDEPQIITKLTTDFGEEEEENELRMVCCLSHEEIWTCGDDSLIRLYDLKGELLTEIPTNSGDSPQDIAMTNKDGNGYLVYIDCSDRTVNIMKSVQVQKIIRLESWNPIGVCGTSSGEFLVIMVSDFEQTKVVRYSKSTAIQSIEITDSCPPHYLADGAENSQKYICENNNLDICVSDTDFNVVVVFDHAGKLRFQYTGKKSPKQKRFWPNGITTDSQSRILIADSKNKYIHVLDKDGQFLRGIDNCDLVNPWGICVNTRDDLFVAEKDTGIIKKIQYCK